MRPFATLSLLLLLFILLFSPLFLLPPCTGNAHLFSESRHRAKCEQDALVIQTRRINKLLASRDHPPSRPHSGCLGAIGCGDGDHVTLRCWRAVPAGVTNPTAHLPAILLFSVYLAFRPKLSFLHHRQSHFCCHEDQQQMRQVATSSKDTSDLPTTTVTPTVTLEKARRSFRHTLKLYVKVALIHLAFLKSNVSVDSSKGD